MIETAQAFGVDIGGSGINNILVGEYTQGVLISPSHD